MEHDKTLDEARQFLFAIANPWDWEGPEDEGWPVCRYCRSIVDGHLITCEYRLACEQLAIKMNDAYDVMGKY